MTGTDDESLLDEIGQRLAGGIGAALPGWVVAEVERIHRAFAGSFPDAVRDDATAAGRRAAADIGAELRALLARDIDDQHTNPMSVVRRAASYPTAVLSAAGVPDVVRDEHAERLFPDDRYDLTPASFGDLDPELQPIGLAWGAAKAKVHLGRRNARPS